MKLYIKQKIFSWREKFYIYDESGHKKYYVLGKLISIGKKLNIYDMDDHKLGHIHQKLISLLPRYYIGKNDKDTIEVVKKITLLRPKYRVTGLDWEVVGDFLEHNYDIETNKRKIAKISKKWLSWSDTYQIDIADDVNEIDVISIVIIIDAILQSEKETANNKNDQVSK